MRVNHLLSTDDTRVIVLTTLEFSLNRQIEKYSGNEITRAREARMENEASAEFYRNKRPDLFCLLPTVYRSFVYVLQEAPRSGARRPSAAGQNLFQSVKEHDA
jgi:hypothetical protein